MPDARYSIDTSSLIHGWREVYFPENFEGFWQKLGELADSGVLVASKEVLREVKRRDEGVYQWCRDYESMFLELDEAQMENLSTIIHGSWTREKGVMRPIPW